VVVLQVTLVLAMLDLVQRRLRDVDVAALDQVGHLAVEEGEQQGADVGAVDVRVGHDNDAVVAQLLGLEVLLADAGAQRRDERGDLLRGDQLVETRALDVQDLALERQDRLELAVASLLGRAAGRVALHQVELRERRVLFLAVRELARQAETVQYALAPGHLARLARRFARPRRLDDLADDDLGVGRLFQQPVMQRLRDGILDHGTHFRGNELVLGLRGEFRVRELDGQDAGQPLPHVVAGGFDLGALGQLVGLDVLVQGARHGRAQRGQVRAAVALRDVVGEAEHRLLVGVVPLHRHLDADAVAVVHGVENVRVQDGLGAVDVFDEALHPAAEGEDLLLAGALVVQLDAHAVVEEGQLAQPFGQDVVVELDVAEDFRAGMEVHLGAAPLGGAGHRQRRDRVAVAEFHHVGLAVAPDRELELAGQRVDHRHPDAVQAAGDLVAVAVELAARVQHRHHDFGGGAAFLRVHVRGNAAAVVDHADRVVGVDDDLDLVAMARQGLVDGVVDDLEHHVVQAGAVAGVADVHARALAHRFQALEYLDAVRVVFR
jgi:hypothetical protein